MFTKEIERILPERLWNELSRAGELVSAQVEEIRLRLGRGNTVKLNGEEYFLCQGGSLSRFGPGIVVTQEDLDHVLDVALNNSFFSYKKDLSSGFVTLSDGCRLGVSGTAVYDGRLGEKLIGIKNITSINIRIPREVKGCSEMLYRRFFSDGPSSLLLAGPPGSGKTTFLRDLTRSIGNRWTVSVIDERRELSARGAFDLGAFTDVFTSYDRYSGIMTAIRVMSPRVVVCDEIGSEEDVRALEYALNSGACILATCHCNDLDELKNKRNIAKLTELRAFDYIVLLENKEIRETMELK